MAADAPNSTLPEPRRFSIRLPRPRWLGFAAVAMVLVAVGLRFGVPIYRQQFAIREIKRFGGTVDMRYRGPQWLLERLGDELMNIGGEVIRVDLMDSEAPDAALAHLAWLPKFEALVLVRTRVTDAGMVHVAGLTGLQGLSLGDTAVTDVGLASLKGLKKSAFA